MRNLTLPITESRVSEQRTKIHKEKAIDLLDKSSLRLSCTGLRLAFSLRRFYCAILCLTYVMIKHGVNSHTDYDSPVKEIYTIGTYFCACVILGWNGTFPGLSCAHIT